MDIIHVKAMTRKKNEDWLKGEKANQIVGGLLGTSERDKKVKCFKCGRDLFLSDSYDDVDDLVEKDAKVICPYCMLKYNISDMNFEQFLVIVETISFYEGKVGENELV